MALVQLLYISTAGEDIDDAELTRILESAVRHNSASNITGMLLFSGGMFMQVLEGEEKQVDEAYARIEADPRHSQIEPIAKLPVEQRDFAQWHMGFHKLEAEDASAHPAYAALIKPGFDAESLGIKPGLALEIMQHFSRRMNQAAQPPTADTDALTRMPAWKT